VGGTEQADPARPSGRRRPGRPRGDTAQGAASRDELYRVAIRLITSKGYEGTTLRDIAKEAGVSVGLLYRYFPSKSAVVLALYDELSADYATRAAEMRPGPWRKRFSFALETSLGILAPHRATLASLTPVLVGDATDGLFSEGTSFSRHRVQSVSVEAVRNASDAPPAPDAEALGRLLYLVHLVVILWWLFDKSSRQKTTFELTAMLERLLPAASLAVRLKSTRAFIRAADGLCREGLFGEAPLRLRKDGPQ
jgi:AcrR family transcriptional regulator